MSNICTREILIQSCGARNVHAYFRFTMVETTPLANMSLEDILPHRDTMLLVSEVIEVDQKHALTLCQASSSWPMVEKQGILSLVLVEVAAQTAGVCNGWDRIHTKGIESEKMGWLVGIKKAEFFIDYLPLDCIILSRAETMYSFTNLREVFCQQHIDSHLVGQMTLQLFQA